MHRRLYTFTAGRGLSDAFCKTLYMQDKKHTRDARPVEEGCDCPCCRDYSRAYLQHLVRMKELSSHRLLSIHNLHYTFDLITGARKAIATGSFDTYMSSVRVARENGSS